MSAGPIELHWVQQPGSKVTGVYRPTTIEEAVRLLADVPDVRPIAGGTDLLLELARDGHGADVSLLDLTAIQNWSSIDTSDAATIVLAGGVTHNDVLASTTIVEELLPLAQACMEVGSPQLRNRATVAGNLATASPANDTISALLALGAELRVVRHDGANGIATRTIAVQDFFTGFRSTALQPGELITEIRVPRPPAGRRGVWVKLGLRRAQAISVVHAGFVVDLDDQGIVTHARIALGSVAPTVELNPAAADALVGSMLDQASIAAAATAAAATVTPIDDVRATAAYRSDTIVTVVTRALTALQHRRQRDTWPARVPLMRTPATHVRGRAAHNVDEGGEVAVTVNGSALVAPIPATGTLLDWLRETAGTGTKEGCAEGECGACTVQLDGHAVMSCLVHAAQADGATVTTVEGLAAGGEPSAMQSSFVETFAVQCGYCIPGFVVAASTLAAELPEPSRAEIELGLSGNLCRCTGYYSIIDAVTEATSAS